MQQLNFKWEMRDHQAGDARLAGTPQRRWQLVQRELVQLATAARLREGLSNGWRCGGARSL